MGIRINKAIGYGLKDLKQSIDEDTRITLNDEDIYQTDFNDFKLLLEDEEKCLEILTSTFGVTSSKAKLNLFNIKIALKMFAKHKKYPQCNDFIDYNIENSKFILFYPINNVINAPYGTWKRHDDVIDYYENRIYKENLSDTIVDLSEHGACGLFPYNHAMLLKPGRENKTKIDRDTIEASLYNQLVGNWSSNVKPCANEETVKHLLEDWCCDIPASIILFIHYFNIFQDPMTVYELKPLLCQWWS